MKAIKLLSSGKAPGSDAIPAEIYKAGGPPVAEKPKEKRKPSLKNSRMQQLSTYSKGRGILKSVTIIVERSGLLPESKCGFRKNRGTIDMIFTARQLQEKCQEQNVDLYVIFVDLTKAFDNQSWGTLENYGKVWLSCQIHSNGAAVPRWYACKGPKWWRVFWSISCDKWNEARLCTSFNTVQYDVFCHAYRCFPGWWQWYIY